MPEGTGRRLQRAWYSQRAPWALLPFSWLYRVAIAIRSRLFRSGWLGASHPGVPVVVVGNITVGGTGKTPVVLWLAGQLQQRDIRVGIASRGYGGSDPGPRVVETDADVGKVGDEALMLARVSNVPVCIARRRAQAATTLAQRGCQLVLCDDGLQHLALRRDLEIAVVDARRGLGNGALLPAGPLREPAARLERVDFVLVNGDGPSAGLPAAARAHAIRFDLALGAARALAGDEHRPLAAFAGGGVHAVAGIGDPGRFFMALRDAGLQVIEHPFPDHHAFTRADLDFRDGRPVLMTQKDAVKCEAFADGNLWFVPAGARFAPADAARIVERIARLLPAGGTSNSD